MSNRSELAAARKVVWAFAIAVGATAAAATFAYALHVLVRIGSY